MTVPLDDDRTETFDCISIAQQTRRPRSTFLFALFLACLALPATTPLPLGSYPPHSERLSPSVWARRWMFLATKLTLLVPMVTVLSFDLAFSIALHNHIAALYLQLATSFFGLLFAFRWALRDQRMRCPVCLARLSNPARVGQASCNFLAWHGTELICTQGHGLLHIPDLQTSWFSSQRWLYLDASWRGVFTEVWPAAAGGAP